MRLSLKVLIVGTSLSIPVLLAGIGIGIASFFILQNEEGTSANEGFKASIGIGMSSTENTVGATTRAVHTISSLFTISDRISPYDDFIPFMTESQGDILGTHSLGWISHVSDHSRASFTDHMRTYGEDYEYFTINTRNKAGQLIPAPTAPSYYPVTYIHPLDSNLGALGLNTYGSPIRRDAIDRSIASGSDAATSRIYLPHTKYQQPGVLYISPVRNDTSLMGFGVGVFIIGDMLEHGLADILDEATVVVFDMGTHPTVTGNRSIPMTTEDWANRNYSSTSFLWSNHGEYGPDFGSDEEVEEIHSLYDGASFRYRYSIPMADRVWDILFIPHGSYVASYSTGTKWATLLSGIFAAILISGIIYAIAIFLYIRWRSARRMYDFEKKVLEDNTERIRGILNRMARAEESKKHILNSIPDMIAIVNRSGKVIYYNSTFSTTLGFKGNDVLIKNVFVELPDDFYMYEVHSDFRETSIHNHMGSEIPISYSTSLVDIDEASLTRNVMESESGSSIEMNDASKSFLLYIRDLRDNKALLREVQNANAGVQNLVTSSEFEKRWNDPGSGKFRKMFIRFCNEALNGENINFIIDVDAYRKLPNFDERIREQERIMNHYVRDSAPVRLNLSSFMYNDIEKEAKDSLGSTSVFDKVLLHVKMTVAIDLYPRFIGEERKRGSTSSTTTSTSV